MIARHIVHAERIRSELANIEGVVSRVRRAMEASAGDAVDSDLYWDAVALNLHDFYTGLERVLRHIAAEIDGHLPAGGEWHQELLRANGHPRCRGSDRPYFLTRPSSAWTNICAFATWCGTSMAFEFDPQRIKPLAEALTGDFAQVKDELSVLYRLSRRVGRRRLALVQ